MLYELAVPIRVYVDILDEVFIRGYATLGDRSSRETEGYLGRALGAFYYVWLLMLDLLKRID
jgi:hypothetical protein